MQGLKPGAFQLWVRGSQLVQPHHQPPWLPDERTDLRRRGVEDNLFVGSTAAGVERVVVFPPPRHRREHFVRLGLRQARHGQQLQRGLQQLGHGGVREVELPGSVAVLVDVVGRVGTPGPDVYDPVLRDVTTLTLDGMVGCVGVCQRERSWA